MKPQLPIHRLKRLAKLRARDEKIPLHEALDQIARAQGAASWSLFLHLRKTGGNPKIDALPIRGSIRVKLCNFADEVLENVIAHMEPDTPDIVRWLWNVDTYLDLHFFQEAELPMDVDYAEYLIEATIWHHIVDLAVQADKLVAAK